MIINSIDKITATDRDVAWGNGKSRRLLVEKDKMGYSLTDTIIDEGSSSMLEYKNHLEACYCIEGEGEVVDQQTGETHHIAPGVMYALDKNEKHLLRASKTMRLVCVFNPPLKGHERHSLGNESSAY